MTPPMAKEAPGCRMMPAVAPMTTPPARVALRMCSMVNFDLTAALVMKVERQLPVKDRMVLVMIWVLVKGVGAAAPKLNEGQYIHRNNVPMSPKRFEKQLEPGLLSGFIIELNIRLETSPEYAPKAWMVILPPTSKALIFSKQINSLSVYTTSWTRHMIMVSSGPTLPITTPKLMNMLAAEQRASVNDSQLTQIQQFWLLNPSDRRRFQKAERRRQSCTITAFMKKVQETADQENDLEKAIRKPKPISIITFTSWQAGYRQELKVVPGRSSRTNTPYRMTMDTSTIDSSTTKRFKLSAWCQTPPFMLRCKILLSCNKMVIEG